MTIKCIRLAMISWFLYDVFFVLHNLINWCLQCRDFCFLNLFYIRLYLSSSIARMMGSTALSNGRACTDNKNII